jgi:hypothetical protein
MQISVLRYRRACGSVRILYLLAFSFYLSPLKNLILILSLVFITSGCTLFSGGDTVTVVKPRYHKTWPKKHRWHKKIKVWKFTVQAPERGGVKKVKMRN